MVNRLTDELDEGERWELIESALGSIDATGHEWDDDPAAWVRQQRRILIEAVDE